MLPTLSWLICLTSWQWDISWSNSLSFSYCSCVVCMHSSISSCSLQERAFVTLTSTCKVGLHCCILFDICFWDWRQGTVLQKKVIQCLFSLSSSIYMSALIMSLPSLCISLWAYFCICKFISFRTLFSDGLAFVWFLIFIFVTTGA